MVEFRLDPSRQQFFDITRRAAVRELEKGRQERLAPIIQRVGLGSPAIARQEQEAEAGLQTNLLDLLSRLGIQQTGEQRQERLIGEERGEKRRLTRAQFLQRSKEQERGILAREEELESQQQFAEEQQRRQFEERRRLLEEARRLEKRQRGQNLLRQLISTGLNIGSRFLFPPKAGTTGAPPIETSTTFPTGQLSLFQHQPQPFGTMSQQQPQFGNIGQNFSSGFKRFPQFGRF
jgi:hypothetical protein